MLVAAIDLETTGIHPAAEIIEFGACIVDIKTKVRVSESSLLFKPVVWDNFAEAASSIHQIPKEIIMQYGLDIRSIDIIEELRYKPDLIVSHNAKFEKTMINKYWPELSKMKWLCTLNDIDHTLFTRHNSRVLSHLIQDYDIHTVSYHRALDDARSCAQLLLSHNVEEIIANIDAPKYEIYIGTRGESEATIEAIKRLGFRWDRDVKAWKIGNKVKADADIICDGLKRVAPHLKPLIEAQ